MFSELKKSFGSVVNERVTSPFWGAIILSWMFWNWKIFTLLLFISENSLPNKEGTNIKYNKVEYIIEFYSDWLHVWVGPLISAFIIITVIPFIVNGSYWLALRFKKWRISQKNISETSQVLTVEQSIQLRTEIRDQEKKFHEMLEDKNQLIITQRDSVNDLNKQVAEKQGLIDQYKDQINSSKEIVSSKEEERRSLFEEKRRLENDINRLDSQLQMVKDQNSQFIETLRVAHAEVEQYKKDYIKAGQDIDRLQSQLSKFNDISAKVAFQESIEHVMDIVSNNLRLANSLETILFLIQRRKGDFDGESIETNAVAFFQGHDIIRQNEQGRYSITDKGKEFLKLYSSRNISN